MKKSIIESSFIVVLTFVLIAIVAFFPFNLKFFNSFKNAFYDFSFTDIYYSDLKPDNSLNTEIVIVNIGNGDRVDISKQIEIISKYNPQSISLDAFFLKKKNDSTDYILKNAIVDNNVITTSKIKYDNNTPIGIITSDKYFEANHGFANLYIKGGNSVIRNFTPYIISSNNDTINSFASEIVKQHNATKYYKLINRNNSKEIIKYSANQENFIAIDKNDILEDTLGRLKSIFKEKHVILGYLGDSLNSIPNLEDRHFTPMNSKLVGKSNPDTYGVVIQANILSMILSENYINKSSLFISLFISTLLMLLATYLFIKDYIHRPMWFHFKAKVIQLLIMVILIYIEMMLYHYFNYKLDLSLGIAGILLTVDVIYFYDGFAKYLNKKFNYNSIFLHSSH